MWKPVAERLCARNFIGFVLFRTLSRFYLTTLKRYTREYEFYVEFSLVELLNVLYNSVTSPVPSPEPSYIRTKGY